MLRRRFVRLPAVLAALPSLVILVAACSSSSAPNDAHDADGGVDSGGGSGEDAHSAADSGAPDSADSQAAPDTSNIIVGIPDSGPIIQFDAAIKCGMTSCIPPQHCCAGVKFGTGSCANQSTVCPAELGDNADLTPDPGASASPGE